MMLKSFPDYKEWKEVVSAFSKSKNNYDVEDFLSDFLEHVFFSDFVDPLAETYFLYNAPADEGPYPIIPGLSSRDEVKLVKELYEQTFPNPEEAAREIIKKTASRYAQRLEEYSISLNFLIKAAIHYAVKSMRRQINERIFRLNFAGPYISGISPDGEVIIEFADTHGALEFVTYATRKAKSRRVDFEPEDRFQITPYYTKSLLSVPSLYEIRLADRNEYATTIKRIYGGDTLITEDEIVIAIQNNETMWKIIEEARQNI